MMNLQKNKPWRNKPYLQWVKSLPCCVTGHPADDFHHLIACGLGGSMGSKIGDNFTIPLTRQIHMELHHDPVLWESRYGKQRDFLAETAKLALKEGKLEGLEFWAAGL